MKISFKVDIKEEDMRLALKMLFNRRLSGFDELLSSITIGDIYYNKADGSGFTSTHDMELFMKQLELLCNEHSVDIDWLPSILLITMQYSQFDDDVHADTYNHNILISDAEFLLSNMVTSYRRYIELRNAKREVLPEDRFLSLIKSIVQFLNIYSKRIRYKLHGQSGEEKTRWKDICAIWWLSKLKPKLHSAVIY